MPPVCVRNIRPPVVMVPQIHATGRLLKYHGGRTKHFRLCSWVVFSLWRTLCDCHVTRLVHKLLELLIGYGGLIYPKPFYSGRVSRCLFRIVVVGSHYECATGNKAHVPGWQPANSFNEALYVHIPRS